MKIRNRAEQAEPACDEATRSVTPPLPGARPAQLLSLQRAAGNRAVAAFLARQPTATKKKPPLVTLIFIPDEPMTPHEFAVRSEMQFYRLSQPEAERRVTEAEQHGGAGTGPHYENGVRADEVGKKIKIGMDLSGQSVEEVEEQTARSEELAHLPAAERSAIDLETDRRFWARIGMDPGTKLTRGAGDAANRDLWMRTRDEVVHDRNRIESLPAQIHDFLVPKGKQVTPEEYSAVLRIVGKMKSFSDEDWALYRRRINGATNNYSVLEQSIDRFLAQQASETKVKDRIAGTESLWQLRKKYKELESVAYKSVGGGAAPIQSPAFVKRLEDARVELENALHATHFKDVAEYEAACQEYLQLVMRRAREIALLALRASEQVVQAEYQRYQDAGEVQGAFDRLATMRKTWKGVTDAALRARPTHHIGRDGVGWDDPRTPAQEAAERERVEKVKQVEAERQKQSEQSPLLKDPELLTGVIAGKDDPAALGRLLRDDSLDRLANIAKTRRRILEDPEAVLQFDRVIKMTLKELGAGPGSAGALIVGERMEKIHDDGLLKSIALAVLAIGLGLLTFGTGTIAVLAGGAALTLSVYQAGEEWEKYSNAYAAAHTAFDKSDALSSDEPTIVWLAVSLISIGFDGAALVNTMKAAAPAARVMAKGGEIAEFDAALAKVTELSDGVKQALSRFYTAEREFQAAAEDLSNYWRAHPSVNGVFDPTYLGKVGRAAYFGAKNGIRKFEVFLARVKAQKFMKGIDVEKLSPEQLKAIEEAFNEGVKEFDAAVPVFTVEVKYAKGTSKLTVDKGQLLLDGKAVGATKREEILEQVGLSHANWGHGALRDQLTIAHEAVQNAAKPKSEGMSSIFSSDEVMLRSLEAAKAELAAGKGVKSGARTLVEVPTTPDAGRVFIAKSKLQGPELKGVTPLNDLPFESLPEVAELPVTHVRALFSEVKPGEFEIKDIFPAYKKKK